MGTNFGIINSFYNEFSNGVHQGYGAILPDVNFILNVLIVISIGLTAILVWTSETDSGVLRGVIQRILMIGFFVYLTENWQTLVGTIIDSFFDLGAKAGGGSDSSSGGAANVPYQLMSQGYNLAISLTKVMENYSGFTAVFLHMPAMLCYAAAVLLILGSFMWLAVEVFLAIIEYKIICLAGFIFVPLNVWSGTAAFGGGILRYILAAGAKVLTIAIVANLSTTVLKGINVSQTLDIENAAAIAFGAIITMLLTMKVPHMAASLVSGQAAFSASGALGSMSAAAVGAFSGAKAAGNVAQAVTSTSKNTAVAAYRAASKLPDRLRGGSTRKAS